VVVQPAAQRDALLDVFRGVAEFGLGFGAVEQGGGDDGVALGGDLLAHVADVVVHAEDFLDDDDAGAGILGPGAPGGEAMAVMRGESDGLAHVDFPLVCGPGWGDG